MAKTKILTTNKGGKGKQKKKKAIHQMTRKVKAKHKGYPMKGILKGQMTYKGKGKKR